MKVYFNPNNVYYFSDYDNNNARAFVDVDLFQAFYLGENREEFEEVDYLEIIKFLNEAIDQNPELIDLMTELIEKNKEDNEVL